ncbi:MAG TPA: DinB family protein [Pyrinomonadaceae bacterium]
MSLSESLLTELEQETQITRRVLERIKDEHLNFKPHPKSRTLGELALHIATVPGAVAAMAIQDKVQAPTFKDPSPNSIQEIHDALEKSIARAKEVLSGVSDEVLHSSWTMMLGDKEIFSQPKLQVLRSIMLNHWYHHRGQLSVYLRELDVPIPSIYGPSADENPLAAQDPG